MAADVKLFEDDPNEVREGFEQFFVDSPLDDKDKGGKVPETTMPQEGEEGAGADGGAESQEGAGQAKADAQRRRGRPRKESVHDDAGADGAGRKAGVSAGDGVPTKTGGKGTDGKGAGMRLCFYGNREMFEKVKYVSQSRRVSVSDYLTGIISSQVEKDYSALSAEDLELIRRYNERFGGMKQ